MQPLKHVVAVLPEYSPSTVINVVTPLRMMHDAGMIHATIRLQNEVTPVAIAAADAIVLCRNWHPAFQPAFELALRLGVPMIYDLDDHVLAAPFGSYTAAIFENASRREMFEWLLKACTLIRVHSTTLRDVIRAYNDNVQVVWAPVNWTLVPQEIPTLTREPIQIVYAAQREIGERLYRLIEADIHLLLREHGSRVQMHFMGYNPPDLCGQPQVTCHAFESDYAAFFSRFTRAGYAIGLAPMIDDVFHNCKTNVKFRDYAAAGAAGVYADTPLYRDNGVIDGENGLLVSGEPGSWSAAVTRLIDNPALLETIRQRAYQDVRAKYSLESVAATWLDQLNTLPARRALSAAEAAEIEALRWSFTYVRKPDTRLTASLRGILRDHLPMRWKLRYYDAVHALRKLVRR